MTLRLNGSTSGYTEIDAPAVAGNNTLVLPGGNGSNQQVLATNGSGALSWSNRPILQVVSATYSTSQSTSSSTFADTGLTASITPASSSNKILVLVDQNGCGKNNATSLALKLFRGATELAVIAQGGGYTNSTAANRIGSCSISYLDSPATTSSVTYKTQYASVDNVSFATVQDSSSVSSIILLEVAA